MTAVQERDDVESRMAEIWGSLLGVEAITPSDNFFKLGADSAKATMLMVKIEEEMGLYLDPIEIFNCPNFEQFVELVRAVAHGPNRVTVGNPA